MVKIDGAELFREEARRMKAIAIEKYKAGDLVGAKEFAVRAQRYSPGLFGLLRLNAVLDVRSGFAKKTNNEVDWYNVLSVDPTADLETIKERYRKLSLDIMLDDDISIGGIEEANQILDDSWKYLCNRKEKQLYDKRREIQQLQNVADGGTFWTLCPSCRYQYEYQNYCKDQMVLCFHCYKTFRAIECPAPSIADVTPWTYEVKEQLKRKIESRDPSAALKVEVKKNLFLITEFRRITGHSGLRYGKLVRSPTMLRRALLDKSKSIITEEEMRGEEKRRKV